MAAMETGDSELDHLRNKTVGLRLVHHTGIDVELEEGECRR